MTSSLFTLVAHRGASAEAPENTFASFDLALEQGVEHLEMDAHLTRGGVPVIIHDDTADRTTNGHGPVREKTLLELKRLDAGGWFAPRFVGQQIPTLAEVLERYGRRAILHIELKGDDSEVARQVVRLVKAWGLLERVVFSSFVREHLAQVRELIPDQPLYYLAQDLAPGEMEEALRLGARAIAAPAAAITPELAEQTRERGLDVGAWGVRSEDDLRRVVEAGCIGCTVDWPRRGLGLLKAMVRRR